MKIPKSSIFQRYLRAYEVVSFQKANGNKGFRLRTRFDSLTIKGTHFKDYLRIFNDLAPKIENLSDADTQYFLHGLPDTYRRECLLPNAKSLKECQELTQKYHYALQAGHLGFPSRVISSYESSPQYQTHNQWKLT